MKSKINEKIHLPRCIAVVMDGNGRWAKKRGLPRSAGHSAGAANFKTICRHANKIGVKYMVFYAFSTENWKRPEEEVNALMKILRDYLRDVSGFKKENMRLRFIGDRSALTPELQGLMADAEATSLEATGMQVVLAINYGGRDEILKAVSAVCEEVVSGKIMQKEIDLDYFSRKMYLPDVPDPDLIIRTSGEFRLSNFLIWQSAYSEFWFSDVLWPDFSPKHLESAIAHYSERERRFGGIS